MDNIKLVQKLNNDLHMELPPGIAHDKLLQKLSEFINHLILTDFQKLVHILYKTDVSETRLKLLLQQNSHEDAAPLIAKLIIERELQKIKHGGDFSDSVNISEEERW